MMRGSAGRLAWHACRAPQTEGGSASPGHGGSSRYAPINQAHPQGRRRDAPGGSTSGFEPAPRAHHPDGMIPSISANTIEYPRRHRYSARLSTGAQDRDR
jgi:hypothetical protein